MAYNPYLYGGGYYSPYQYNGYQQQQQPPMQPQTMQQPAQQLTPPTIHAEIIQVDDEIAATNYPVGAGQSQMLMAKDDSAIFIKSASANGQTSMTVYTRRASQPPKPEINPADYITRDEFEQRIQAIMPAPAQSAPKRAAKKDEEQS